MWMGYIACGPLLILLTLATPTVVGFSLIPFQWYRHNRRPGVGGRGTVGGSGIIGCLYALRRRYLHSWGLERQQVKFVTLGMAAFAISAAIFGLALPALTGSYESAHLTTLSTLFLVGITAYAVVKHRLMDIRLVVLRGVTYVALLFVAALAVVGLVFSANEGLSGPLGYQPRCPVRRRQSRRTCSHSSPSGE